MTKVFYVVVNLGLCDLFKDSSYQFQDAFDVVGNNSAQSVSSF